jgi:ferric-dicitrate binding protein FerR (iron transport regulator)
VAIHVGGGVVVVLIGGVVFRGVGGVAVVGLGTENSEGLKLVKGEKALYNRETKQFSKLSVDAFDNTSSYRSKIFNFKETRLQDVIDQLDEIYLCDIVLSDMKLANCPLTVSFDNIPINEIIDIMAETFGFKVQRNGNTYILSGGECPKM